MMVKQRISLTSVGNLIFSLVPVVEHSRKKMKDVEFYIQVKDIQIFYNDQLE